MDFIQSFFVIVNNHWLLVAFCAPLLWALVNIIDVYFVKGIYKDALDGTIITGLFQIIPIVGIIVFLISDYSASLSGEMAELISFWPILALALCAGFLFNLAFYFYFKALFSHNDVALLQIVWSLTIVLVPILSFVLWGEHLSVYKYAGMGVTLLGVMLLTRSRKLKAKFSRPYVIVMLFAVIILSVSMVFEDKVFESLAPYTHGFFIGFLFFSLGALINAIYFAVLKRRNPLLFIQKFFRLFIIA